MKGAFFYLYHRRLKIGVPKNKKPIIFQCRAELYKIPKNVFVNTRFFGLFANPLKFRLRENIPNMKTFPYLFVALLLLASCTEEKNTLDTVLASDDPKIKKVMKRARKYEVQILYSQINRDSLGKPYFTDFEFNVDNTNYFYPASTVKMPIAFLALEKLKELRLQNIDIDRNTPYKIEGDTIEHLITKDIIEIFAVSDNQAYNRLFEFLGTDHINKKMQDKGLFPSRFSHRLSVPNAANPTNKAITFYNGDSIVYHQEPIINKAPVALDLNLVKKGKGFMEDGKMVTTAMDFSLKNQYSLTAMHNTMKQFVVPGLFEPSKRFDISRVDREFLSVAMSTLPRDVRFKQYDPKEYYDSYVKFFMYGDSKEPIPDNISIYNKVGYAYGYLTDCAYITDYENKIAFILTTTVHVNNNQVFNDDAYEYDGVGIPFLAELGRQVYQQELNRKTYQ